jgi:kumamolisin
VPACPSGFHGRGVPDVAGVTAPSTGYVCFIRGTWVQTGGTSAVSPLWAGLLALVNAQKGGRSGLITPALHAHADTMHPILMVNNGTYHADPGWNACTGCGTPNGLTIAKLLG